MQEAEAGDKAAFEQANVDLYGAARPLRAVYPGSLPLYRLRHADTVQKLDRPADRYLGKPHRGCQLGDRRQPSAGEFPCVYPVKQIDGSRIEMPLLLHIDLPAEGDLAGRVFEPHGVEVYVHILIA
ncbi:hypothetical protein SDC9_198685 [bioreactor metagenome]|uniref:Uncharacterized protein n=1 Tax=bioreactor metagenome TaxID=1076179 RepID=A0A645IRM5_9ZZZZ